MGAPDFNAGLDEFIDIDERKHVWAPDFTAGADMPVDLPVDVWKKRLAQPEISEVVPNKKKHSDIVVQEQTKNTKARMMETGAAIAAQGAAMLQTISNRKKWPKNYGRELRSKTLEFGAPRTNSPSRSRSRHRVLDCSDSDDN